MGIVNPIFSENRSYADKTIKMVWFLNFKPILGQKISAKNI
ncbi:hypothetical protein HMPREF1565_2909 [Providencia alcalifaciens RIMD 1656011]|uniref:Uncharacterized protein n=2 Tax=Providencia alcalifaciens TaxID=126385 RepID=B6XH14_9GAMM|nr:hypothetical protein PROVALCAL_02652 [Providencia alcalifaciens DSM 30120]ETT09081.1 hypothetical protein HMPREF1562_2770 [Providencia alcalifaciens F90-2004]EUC97627.1 hypothetical protein HMPREF1567_3113 [Providencia alcalifaciens PAL-2]EUD04939.1 hypothetical protein HMPREF1565_2909 [Providencia alcalifaciens RIMD 1656011]EUD07393.1 hypothetical protein HMPREF1564_1883 [Providencia alcalifaciens R90-1475]EUD13029.1 hypothetical protein HMPREF1563_1093 [Providencia alcalifaciens 205/92]